MENLFTNWSKQVLCSRCPQSGIWHGYRDVWISPKHTGQFERDMFSTHWKWNHFLFSFSVEMIQVASWLTLCPLVFNCSGRHMLHTSQWKKLLRPPMRQIPQPSQWYWFLSSSSKRLQIRHVYWRLGENWKRKCCISSWEWMGDWGSGC